MQKLPSEFSYLTGKILSSRVYPEFFPLQGQERVLNAGFGDGPQAVVYSGSFASMVGVDVQPERLIRARRMLEALKIQNVELVEADVEKMPLPDGSFDAAIAIDIVEHVRNPEALAKELNRLLKPGGRLLVTFPAGHDKFVNFFARIGRWLRPNKNRIAHQGWHPDDHQRELSVIAWQGLIEAAGFKKVRSRATTMFPPLHLYGVPKFWFKWEWLHRLDRWLASKPSLQNLGQTVMMEFIKA